MNATQITQTINQHLTNGNIIITRNGMLSQEFKTKDDVLECKTRRVGGGFGLGTTLHEVFMNGKSISNRETLPSDNLTKVYLFFIDYCNKTFGS